MHAAIPNYAMCTSDSTGRDSTLQLDLKCLKKICTKIKTALEQNSVENGISRIIIRCAGSTCSEHLMLCV